MPLAQDPPPPSFGAEELDQLLAPIALYPDPLLAQILMAATYPLEVAEAARWVQAYPGLQGSQLEAAMQEQPWDPSVKSLTATPQVLAMMSEHLGWTQKVGEAFLAQQSDVMATVQMLRAKAQAAGYLQSTPEQVVSGEPQAIAIEPANPQVVYVPIYDPTVVYGAWWYPAYPPYAWYPAGYVVQAYPFTFSLGVAVGVALWGGFDWGHHHVSIIRADNFNRFNRTPIPNPTWHYDPNHRRGVAYASPVLRQQFEQGPRPGADARAVFRGRAPESQPSPAVRAPERRPGGGPAPQVRPAPPPIVQASPRPAALEGMGRGAEARTFSDRGRMSRQSLAAPRPAATGPAHPPAPRAFSPAPSPPKAPSRNEPHR